MPLSDQQMKAMEQKREKILQQAILLFAEQGYESTTIAKVAKAAGISFGSVFTYFENKEQLFHQAVIEPLEKEYKPLLLNFNPHAEDPLMEIQNLIDHHIKSFGVMQKYLQFVVQVIGQHSRFSEQFNHLDVFHREMVDKLGLLIENGQKKGVLEESDPEITAIAYTSFLIGIRLINIDNAGTGIWNHLKAPAFQLFYPKR